jgi:hypothetical protein
MHLSTVIKSGAPRLLIGALVGAAVLAGCGPSGTASATASPSLSPNDAARKFAQCMRQHGINLPDPQSSSSGGNGAFVISNGNGDGNLTAGPDDPKFQKAQDACKSFMPSGGQLSPEEQAKMQQNALKFAQCMRQHGINVPDPDFSSAGHAVLHTPGGSDTMIRPDDPKFIAAQKACESILGRPAGANTSGGGGSGLSAGGG